MSPFQNRSLLGTENSRFKIKEAVIGQNQLQSRKSITTQNVVFILNSTYH